MRDTRSLEVRAHFFGGCERKTQASANLNASPTAHGNSSRVPKITGVSNVLRLCSSFPSRGMFTQPES
jgi:hypothetical protein